MTRVSAEAVTATIALGGRASAVVVGPDGEHIYVAQSDSVAVISSCHHIVARVPLDDEPKDLALDAAGRRLFAITYDGSVSVINTCDYTMKTIPCHWGSDVAVSPDGRYQYVARTDNHQILGHSVISAIDAGGRTIATMSVVSLVTGLTVSPDGTRLCAISSDRGSYYQYPPGWLTIIDTARHAVLSTLAIGSNPETVTASPDGAHLYITHHDKASVSVVEPASNKITTVAVDDAPLNVTFTPDSAHAYVTTIGSLVVIDTTTHETTRIITGDLPRGVQFSPDGKRAYVANFGDRSVSVVDTITNSVTTTLAMGGYPDAVAVSPTGDRVYVADYWSGALTAIAVLPTQDQHASTTALPFAA